MPQTPAQAIATVRALRLPLGPLGEPLTYRRRGRGKLHSDPDCPPIVVDGECTGTAVTLTADQVDEGAVCLRCGPLPYDAEQWMQVCGSIGWAREAAARATAIAGDQDEPTTWDDVTSTDQALWTLRWFQRYRAHATPELQPHVTAAATELLASRQHLAASAPPAGGMPEAGGDPVPAHLLVVTGLHLAHLMGLCSLNGPLAHTLAHLNLHSQLPPTATGTWVLVGPPELTAQVLSQAHDVADLWVCDLGPVAPADTTQTWATAQTLLHRWHALPAEQVAEAPVALAAARGIHAPTAA